MFVGEATASWEKGLVGDRLMGDGINLMAPRGTR